MQVLGGPNWGRITLVMPLRDSHVPSAHGAGGAARPVAELCLASCQECAGAACPPARLLLG